MVFDGHDVATGHGTHTETCRVRFENMKSVEDEQKCLTTPPMTIPLTPPTATPPTVTSVPTLDELAAVESTEMAKGGGFDDPIGATAADTGVDGADMEVPTLVIDGQPTMGGRRVFNRSLGVNHESTVEFSMTTPVTRCHWSLNECSTAKLVLAGRTAAVVCPLIISSTFQKLQLERQSEPSGAMPGL